MKIPLSVNNSSQDKMPSFYKQLSLVELIARIVKQSDKLAMDEFHNHRTVFCVEQRQPLRFIEYLDKLRDNALIKKRSSRNLVEIVEMAFDMTLDKFNNLSADTQIYTSKEEKLGHRMKQDGPNCRLYFRAFLDHLNASLETNPPAGEFEQEARASKGLQGLVRRHFYLSLLEAERRINPLWTRYYWKINGQKICVLLPVGLKGRNRKRWLEKNINEPDPDRPGERQRIQSIINRRIPRESMISFDESLYFSNNKNTDQSSDWEINPGESLSNIVAEEKAANILQQRRSIRKLGKTKLKKMIIQIFEDISDDDYHDGEIAKDFDLTKATFSRFAGSRWNQTGSFIPDLWCNTAQVLKDHPIFRQVAKNTGFWGIVVTTVEKSTSNNRKARSHG